MVGGNVKGIINSRDFDNALNQSTLIPSPSSTITTFKIKFRTKQGYILKNIPHSSVINTWAIVGLYNVPQRKNHSQANAFITELIGVLSS